MVPIASDMEETLRKFWDQWQGWSQVGLSRRGRRMVESYTEKRQMN